MAELTRQPLSRVIGYMRDLREAEDSSPAKGRGVTAPDMTAHDAAALYCAIYAAPAIQESAATITALKKLEARPWSRHRVSTSSAYRYPYSEPPFSLGLEPNHTALDGLAALITFFMHEHELPHGYSERRGPGKWGIYANFEIRSPEYSASLVVGVHGRFSERWNYGLKELDSVRTGRCTEITFRKLAACLRS
ncbi:hypothetical protein [Bradyrhizobium sp.]|uniref:hypothetical protein n=1 Tax=Bradyrhizobium sp. TaxID=376 RepID=UPI00261EE9C2|nr:hypothetical protein [Bradyrhizobium sp.]